MLETVNLKRVLAGFDETWVPKVVAELNDQHVKVVKFQGEYVWHAHESEDEMFLILEGTMRLHLRDGVVDVGPGEFVVVPRGVEHKPVAESIVQAVLFEPATTRNTGGVDHRFTIEPEDLQRL